jgi:hypothetical protein
MFDYEAYATALERGELEELKYQKPIRKFAIASLSSSGENPELGVRWFRVMDKLYSGPAEIFQSLDYLIRAHPKTVYFVIPVTIEPRGVRVDPAAAAAADPAAPTPGAEPKAERPAPGEDTVVPDGT